MAAGFVRMWYLQNRYLQSSLPKIGGGGVCQNLFERRLKTETGTTAAQVTLHTEIRLICTLIFVWIRFLVFK